MTVFQVFYYHQAFLPLWITAALLWWFTQLAYRRRHGLITGPQLNRSMSLFSLSVVTSWALGPIPFYVFLFSWLYRQPGRGHPVLGKLNLALATFLVVSCLGHTLLDLQQPLERKVARILDARQLDELMQERGVTCQQALEWARLRQGRLQSNAVYLLRYCKEPAARQTLETIQRQGPTPLATLAGQSLIASRSQ